jgi:hypothetical protein
MQSAIGQTVGVESNRVESDSALGHMVLLTIDWYYSLPLNERHTWDDSFLGLEPDLSDYLSLWMISGP